MRIFKHNIDNMTVMRTEINKNTDMHSTKSSSKSADGVRTLKPVSVNQSKTKLSQINKDFLKQLGFILKK